MHAEPHRHSLVTKHRILVCACAGSGLTPEEKVHTLLRGFSPADAEVVPVADLCRLAARDREQLARYADAEKLTVVACFPRTVRSLFKWAETDVADDVLRIHNLRTGDPDAIRQLIEADCATPAEPCCGGSTATTEVPAECGCNRSVELSETAPPQADDGWIPWFPVIEKSRCSNCGQCLSFCLFGVYEVVDGKVQVTNPEGCKTGCPACARICPEVAIIFPKYENSPVNGDEITNLDEQKERIRVDMQKILGDNVYAALAERRRLRQQRVLLRAPQAPAEQRVEPAKQPKQPTP
jgi:Pyruvate/2-oxoacid:ferredoxin oxidoreductase delta subunit